MVRSFRVFRGTGASNSAFSNLDSIESSLMPRRILFGWRSILFCYFLLAFRPPNEAMGSLSKLNALTCMYNPCLRVKKI